MVLGLLVSVNLYVFLWRDGSSLPDIMEQAAIAGSAAGGFNMLPGVIEAPSEDAPVSQPSAPVHSAPPAQPWIEGKVGSGDSMGRILKRHELSASAADELIRAMGEHLDFRSIQAGQSYRLRFGEAGRLDAFEFNVSKITKVRATRTTEGKLTAETVSEEVETRVIEIGGTVRSSLYSAFKARGEDTALVSFFVDVFAYDLNFYVDQHVGDTFRMLVEHQFHNGEFYKHGRILAAEYSGKAGTYHAFWWKAPDAHEGKYYDSKGRGIERTFLKTPLKYTRVSSKFNRNRMHPVLHRKRAHLGIDFAAPTGTPIRAAASGRIVFRGPRGGAGNCVIVKHDNGLQTVYMHMSKFKSGQRVGKRVRAKDVIGYVGMTGLATGPHLHFGVKRNGQYVDPFKLKMERVMAVTKKQRAAFEAATNPLIESLATIDTTPKTFEEMGVPDLPSIPE